MNDSIKLEIKKVDAIEGNFIVESYQRGYRWGTDEVEKLLEDISQNGKKNYCLQPIVVKKIDEGYELIDGQQRLTTIYLIYKYMHEKFDIFPIAKFSIDYRIRESSADFLKNIDVSKEEENIDYWFMSEAYLSIKKWFSNKISQLPLFYDYFENHVSVIWYEVDKETESIPLFERLNIGKIPLTSSELVKAMLLSQINRDDIDKSLKKERQYELSLQWDNIEKRLNDKKLWYYLTNDNVSKYQTRIDLILDLLVDKPPSTKDKYYTFSQIYKMLLTTDVEELFKRIEQVYFTLCDWYENHKYYHKIGYLIASESNTLQEIYAKFNNLDQTKTAFENELDLMIKESVFSKIDYGELNYNKGSEKELIKRILLLFNIISVMNNGEDTQWFPFDKYKSEKEKGNIKKKVWSLEHIHAQNSQGLNTKPAWHEWLKNHLSSLKSISPGDPIITEVETIINKDIDIGQKKFDDLYAYIFNISSKENSNIDTIANLALLNVSNNATLNNSTFDVKRNEIIEMDKNGEFIPYCTKMLFLKYYSKSDNTSLHFWEYHDMKSYVDNINLVLKDYLNKKIVIEKEEGNNGNTI